MKTSRIAIAILGALSLVACSTADSADGSTSNLPEEETVDINIGYLHTLAVDDKFQLGIAEGYFADEGLNIEMTQFDTGVAASQALSGGSIDVALMGAVMTNYAAIGEGQIMMLNAIEDDTAQLWAQPDSGIESVDDLRGKTVVTTEGTTADIFLTRALDEAGINRDEVDVVNSSMSDAVQAFASGAVEAIALWAPFDLRVQDARPEAVFIDSAGQYPEAAIASGWMANDEWYNNNTDTMERLIRGWLKSNEAFRNDQSSALETVQEAAYQDEAPLEDLEHQIGLQTDYTNEEWIEIYASGEAHEWLLTIQESFIEVGALGETTDPSQMLDESLFLQVAEDFVSQ